MKVEILVQAGGSYPYVTKRVRVYADPKILESRGVLSGIADELIYLAVQEAAAKLDAESEDLNDDAPNPD